MVQRFLTAIYKKIGMFCRKLIPGSACQGFVLLLRLENMPLLSDRLGQGGMTYLLLQLSLRLSNAIRVCDSVKIVSPGVFAVILHSRSASQAMAVAIRLQQSAQEDIAVSGETVTPVLTGLVVQNDTTETSQFNRLMAHANHMLSRLKSEHLGCIGMAHLKDDPLFLSLPLTVTQAAQMGQITAYFQPKLCCHTGIVTGFEILARWKHPIRGLLLPAEFTPGMTWEDHHALTLTMMEQAFRALTSWKASGYPVPTVSINISIHELNDPRFSERILKELELYNLLPEMLIIEVLESIGPIHTNEAAHKNLKRLRDAGCLLDLDDFGIGHASLDAVRSFGVCRIKIDRSFVTGCHDSPEQKRMILGIFALAEQLGITTIAEGVETLEEHSYLAQIGCSEVQGFAIAHPMPFSETFTFLKEQKLREQSVPRIPLRKNE